HGAALVAGVLNDPTLRAQWEDELGQMRTRIHSLRAGLVERLAAHGAPQYGFIQRQAGMFSYSGLSKAQVERLRDEFGIYAVGTGRICVAALSLGNLDYVAKAVAAVSGGLPPRGRGALSARLPYALSSRPLPTRSSRAQRGIFCQEMTRRQIPRCARDDNVVGVWRGAHLPHNHSPFITCP